MSRTARALWLILLMNIAMIVGVLVYGLGNIPLDGLKGALKWFTIGVILAGVDLTFANMAGLDARVESVDLEDVPPKTVRLLLGVVAGGALGLAVFVKGVIATVSMLVA